MFSMFTARRMRRRRMEQRIRNIRSIERPTLSRRKFISGRLGGSKGFTLVELMVVISIIVILITMAIPIYNNTIRRAKETVLKQNLFSLRTVIDNYTYDKQKAPQTLQDLVSDGYLRN